MGESTLSAGSRQPSSKKPYKDFPLFAHQTNRWAKKIRGKLVYFGKVSTDPKGEKALALWLDQKDALLAGRKPRKASDEFSVGELCNRFLTVKNGKLILKEITQRTFDDYYQSCERLIRVFGKERPVDDLMPEDFDRLRTDISKRWGPTRLRNEIQRVRCVFRWGAGRRFCKPVDYADAFERPTKKVMRKHRASVGPKMYDPEQIRAFLDTAGPQLKAMVLLGVNCALGNTDCSTLPIEALDLSGGWINYPRPKTAIERRCPLWPETIEALKHVLATRKQTDDTELRNRVFVTRFGKSWHKDTADNPITKEFAKLVRRVDEAREADALAAGREPPAKLTRKGLGFYTLRHVFRTIADEVRDTQAINLIMGHSDTTMASYYRERISDERLKAVTRHVHVWLFDRGGDK